MEGVRSGLRGVLSDVPAKTGYAQGLFAFSQQLGAVGRLELGYRPWPNLAAFGFGELSTQLGASVGAGIRYNF